MTSNGLYIPRHYGYSAYCPSSAVAVDTGFSFNVTDSTSDPPTFVACGWIGLTADPILIFNYGSSLADCVPGGGETTNTWTGLNDGPPPLSCGAAPPNDGTMYVAGSGSVSPDQMPPLAILVDTNSVTLVSSATTPAIPNANATAEVYCVYNTQAVQGVEGGFWNVYAAEPGGSPASGSCFAMDALAGGLTWSAPASGGALEAASACMRISAVARWCGGALCVSQY